MRLVIALTCFLACAGNCAAQTPSVPGGMRSEAGSAGKPGADGAHSGATSATGARGAASLDDIVPPGVKPVAIVAGMKFTEGPVWVGVGGGVLYFSDIPGDTVYKWTPAGEGKGDQIELSKAEAEIVLQPSGNSNGLTLLGRGPSAKLLLAQHAGRVSSMPLGGTELSVLAEKFEGKSLNSPNDLVCKSDGSIYFTDPPYGLGGANRTKELDFCGVFRLGPDGALTLLNKTMPTPNGLAFSPDESILYVADTSRGEIRAFGVKPDGTLDDGRVFAELRAKNDKGEERPAGGDGVRVDVQGNVYCAARGGVWVFTPKGDKLGVIETNPSPTNLCFGGPNNRTMFITTRSGVHALGVKVAGR